MSLPERLKLLADAGGCSLRELDRLAHRREGHVQALIAGTIARPTADVIVSYADALGISRAWLVFGEGDPPTPEAVRAAVERARATGAGHTASDFVAHPSHPPHAA